MTLKIDIRKAFDSMDWDFLLAMLHNFDFLDQIYRWVQVIFSTARIFILINGAPKGYFSCSRGLR